MLRPVESNFQTTTGDAYVYTIGVLQVTLEIQVGIFRQVSGIWCQVIALIGQLTVCIGYSIHRLIDNMKLIS